MVLQKQTATKQKGWQEAQVASRTESAPGDRHQENESDYQASTKS